MDTDAQLKQLGSVAGVNFLELKEKYSKTDRVVGSAVNNGGGPSPSLISRFHEAKAKTPGIIPSCQQGDPTVADTSVTVDVSRICKACRGQGIVTYGYNHMVLSKNCDSCDGEGVVLVESVQAD
jgi:hypothetical protein